MIYQNYSIISPHLPITPLSISAQFGRIRKGEPSLLKKRKEKVGPVDII